MPPFEWLIECGVRTQRAAEILLAAFSTPAHLKENAARLAEIERQANLATPALCAVLGRRLGLRFDRSDYLLIAAQLDDTVASFGRVTRWAVACELSAFDGAPCELARGLCGVVRVVRDMLERISNARRVHEYSEFVDLFAEAFRVEHARALARTFEVRSDPIAIIGRQGLYHRLNVVLGDAVGCARAIERVALKHG